MLCCARGRQCAHNSYVAFIMNSFLLCVCYFLYTLGWIGHTSSCGQSGSVVSYIAATSSAFNAILSVTSFVLFSFLLTRSEHYIRGFTVILIIFSCTSLVYAVISSTTMFASLYVKFNPSCLDSRKARRDFLYISIVAAYHMISYLVLLLISIMSLDSVQSCGDVDTDDRSGDVESDKCCKCRDTVVTFME